MYFILAIMLYVVGVLPLALGHRSDVRTIRCVGMIYYTWPISIFCIVVIWLILRGGCSRGA